jgi:hypothetical protein
MIIMSSKQLDRSLLSDNRDGIPSIYGHAERGIGTSLPLEILVHPSSNQCGEPKSVVRAEPSPGHKVQVAGLDGHFFGWVRLEMTQRSQNGVL